MTAAHFRHGYAESRAFSNNPACQFCWHHPSNGYHHPVRCPAVRKHSAPAFHTIAAELHKEWGVFIMAMNDHFAVLWLGLAFAMGGIAQKLEHRKTSTCGGCSSLGLRLHFWILQKLACHVFFQGQD